MAFGASAETRRLAVVVGANHGAEGQVRLHHAERDALKMAEVLRELGAVAPDDVTLLTDGPTAKDVLRALAEAEKVAAAAQAQGNDVALVFYYSGHATRGHLELSGTRLSMKALKRYLAQSGITVRVAVLDACHSGNAVRTKGGKRTRAQKPFSFSVRQKLDTEGYAILTSSAAGEESQESDELRGSFFTHHLVSGLRGAADGDRDGRVTLSEAYRYAYGRTIRGTAGSAPVAQHPNFDLALKGGGELVLTSMDQAAARVRVAGRTTHAQWFLYSPRTGLVVAEIDERPGQSMVVSVPPGELEVYRRSSASVQRGSIEAVAGREVSLSTRDLKEIPMTAYLRKGQLGLTITANVGVQTFGSDGARDRLVGPAPIFNLGVVWRDVPYYNLDLGIDVGFTSLKQNQVLEDGTKFSQLMIQSQLGATLRYRFDVRRFTITVGPRVAWLFISRDASDQSIDLGSVHTVSVGGVVGAFWRFNERVSIGADIRAAWVPLANDDNIDKHQLLLEGQVSAAFHF